MEEGKVPPGGSRQRKVNYLNELVKGKIETKKEGLKGGERIRGKKE